MGIHPVVHENSIFRYILLKLATRCNLNCTYCYWFRDKGVYQRPPILTIEAETAFLARLEQHIQRYHLSHFEILFHGGEPLLFGKKRFESFCHKLRLLEEKLGFELTLLITTNGVLLDQQWAKLFATFRVKVTLSIDGPEKLHNKTRRDMKGRATLSETLEALRLLRLEGLEPGVLAVCNPDSCPEDVCSFFVEKLGIRGFDILVPDATHEDQPASIARYYKQLFDLWYDSYIEQGVKIRYMETITRGLFGGRSRTESIGYGPITTLTMLTDGALEPLDVLRIAGENATKTEYSIFSHDLQSIQADPLWREVRDASLGLAPVCEQCVYKRPCGGGHIASRWSKTNRYNNPSVYCEDLKDIFGHVLERISCDISVDATVDKVIQLIHISK